MMIKHDVVPYQLNTLCSACCSIHTPNSCYRLSWKEIDGSKKTDLNVSMVSGRLDVYTFEVDKTMNGIFIVVNEQTVKNVF